MWKAGAFEVAALTLADITNLVWAIWIGAHAAILAAVVKSTFTETLVAIDPLHWAETDAARCLWNIVDVIHVIVHLKSPSVTS